jgi:hypothetical protein
MCGRSLSAQLANEVNDRLLISKHSATFRSVDSNCKPTQAESLNCCARTVPKPFLFEPWGLALSEKQIPQVVGKVTN